MLCDSLAGYAVPLYHTLAIQKPLPDRLNPCAHQARSARRLYPSTRIRARPRLPVDSPCDSQCQLALAARRSLLPSHDQPFRPPIWQCPRRAAGARLRSGVPCAPRATPPHATGSSVRSRKLPSHHASSLCSTNHHKSNRWPAPSPHWRFKQEKGKWNPPSAKTRVHTPEGEAVSAPVHIKLAIQPSVFQALLKET